MCIRDSLHSQGVCHRDLKPDNVMINKLNQVKITDLNVAGFNPEYEKYDPMSSFNYKMMTKLGTVLYTAPELIDNFEYSESVDMWSLGAVLYHMLAGEQPFKARLQEEAEEIVLKGLYDIKSGAWSQISNLAKRLVQQMLCVDASRRLTPLQALQDDWFVTQQEQPIITSQKQRVPSFADSNDQLDKILFNQQDYIAEAIGVVRSVTQCSQEQKHQFMQEGLISFWKKSLMNFIDISFAFNCQKKKVLSSTI
eukprot:TRINITY_DN5203_c0_g2_i2.p1 TRINITY_DN5203_c0_g2~~TRINITY_DN5203_c0_g2_i2.p1  ORF type:complete len:252 (+),score=25.72 TRINITY_DN5203_c0_g2_i2:65-820(+)